MSKSCGTLVLGLALVLVVGCGPWPVAISDGIPASIPDHGNFEDCVGVQVVRCKDPTAGFEPGMVAGYPKLTHRQGFGEGQARFELGLGVLAFWQQTDLLRIDVFGPSEPRSEIWVYAAAPEMAFGLRKPEVTLRLTGGVALRHKGPPDSEVTFFAWPQAAALYGFGDSRRNMSGSVGVQASRNAIGPVLLGQITWGGNAIRPEVAVMYPAPWDDGSASGRTTITFGLVFSRGPEATDDGS
jgi:hypothetical protein